MPEPRGKGVRGKSVDQVLLDEIQDYQPTRRPLTAAASVRSSKPVQSQSKPVMRWKGYSVMVARSGGPTYGEAWINPSSSTIHFSQQTYDTLAADDTAMTTALDDMIQSVSPIRPTPASQGGGPMPNMTFTVADSGKWGRAARAEAAAAGTDVVQAKDELTDLTDELNRLILQAASLNVGATQNQYAAFSIRYAKCQRRFDDLTDRMGQLAGLLSLAFTAVVDSGDQIEKDSA